MSTAETFQYRPFLSELLSKNTGHHAVKHGSDFSFRVPGFILLDENGHRWSGSQALDQ